MLVLHVVPHVAQVVGGALFIGIARRSLSVSVLPRAEAERLQRRADQYAMAFQFSPLGKCLVSTDEPGAVVQANPALATMLGYDRVDALLGALLDSRFVDLVVPRQRSAAQQSLERCAHGDVQEQEAEHRLLRADGDELLVAVQYALIAAPPAGGNLILAQIRDITEERRREAQLQYLADHDSLTGIFNRRRFEEELERAVLETRRHRRPAALLVVDLDQFKYVNDTYGHGAGDQILCSVASVLHGRLRADDVVGRLGGDEFGILCRDIPATDARVLADGLLTSLRQEATVTVGRRHVSATASIGISVLDGLDDRDAPTVLAEADIAMYEAKESGRERVSIAFPGAPGLAAARDRLSWAERVRHALTHNGFQFWEQPILNLKTGVCDRSELLIRLVDSETGELLLPGQFLTVAERFGQVQAIDRWCLRNAVELLALRHSRGDRRCLEVNLSGVSLTDERLIDEFEALILGTDFDPTRLIVEITETAAVGNLDLARSVATRLIDLGCSFALDDFGSGFGSFFYLKHLPFTALKIDGEFVKDLPHSHIDLQTVRSIATLTQGLGKQTIAEFVQNEPTIALLTDLGIDYAQGYYIGRPAPVAEFSPIGASRQP